jgi:hypothetical protein
MSQNLMVNAALSQPIFPLNMRGVNEVFPGFALGDFAVLKGSVSSLTSLLCVKAQLPLQLGGLQSNVIFIDGTSNPQIIRGNMGNWKITRFGHASKGRGNTRINNGLYSSLSRNRITVSMQYIPTIANP